MKKLYLESFKRNGMLFFTSDLNENLGIDRNCLLYGSLLGKGEAVFSMIPFEYWDNAYRIIIYTEGKTGSLANICEVLVEEFNASFLTTWGSSIDKNINYENNSLTTIFLI